MVMKKYHFLAALAFVALASCTNKVQTDSPEFQDPLEARTLLSSFSEGIG